MRTNSGELSLMLDDSSVLSRCTAKNELPCFKTGIRDPEFRYRNHHLDIMINSASQERLKTRLQFIRKVRCYLQNRGFDEVETPILCESESGAASEPFVTSRGHSELKLRISPELNLKRLLVAGFDKIFELGKSFRNEGIDGTHNPEFTMLEAYEAYSNIYNMQDLCKEIISMGYQEVGIMVPEFQHFNIIQILTNILSCTQDELFQACHEIPNNDSKLSKAIGSVLNYEECTPDKIFDRLVGQYVEKTCIEPTFLTGYPMFLSPLAKCLKNDPSVADRFELFINGIEIANAYSEQNDAFVQKQQFETQRDKRNLTCDELDFIEALKVGMPPAAGLGIGIDRLLMILTNSGSIKDVIMFPGSLRD